MNDRLFTISIFAVLLVIGINGMLTMAGSLQDTNGIPLSTRLIAFTNPTLANYYQDQASQCSIAATTNPNLNNSSAAAPTTGEGFTPITCKDVLLNSIPAGIAGISSVIYGLAGFQIAFLALGNMFGLAYPITISIVAIISLFEVFVFAYAGSQIVRALFGRSLF